VIAREENKNSISISDIRKVTSACSKPFYYTRKVEEDKRIHHIDNLTSGFSIQPFVIESTGNIGPQADKFISFINNISGVNDVDAATGVRKQLKVRKSLYVEGFCFSAILKVQLLERMISCRLNQLRL